MEKQAENKKKKPIFKVLKWIFSGIATLVVLAVLIPLFKTVVTPELAIKAAKLMIQAEEYESAYLLLHQYENRQDAQELLSDFQITYAREEAMVYDVEGNYHGTVIIERNKDGDITSKVSYDKDSNLLYTDTLTYDLYGNLIEEERRAGDSISTRKKEYVYDSMGNVLEKRYSNPGDKYTRVTSYTYDDRGNLLEMTECYPEGRIVSRKVYTYDANDNLTLFLSYSEYSTPGAREEYQYNDAGQVIKQTNFVNEKYVSHLEYTYTSSGKLQSQALIKDNGLSNKQEYTYDSQDRVIEYVNTNRNGVTRITYAYNFLGNIVEKDVYEDNRHEDHYEYNIAGDLELHIEYDLGGWVDYETVYEFDVFGNIRKQSTIENGKTELDRTHTYNILGQKTQEITYDSDGNEYKRIEYEYDILGNVSVRREYQEQTLKKQYFYNTSGIMTRMESGPMFDESHRYDLAEIGKLIVNYDGLIILYRPL